MNQSPDIKVPFVGLRVLKTVLAVIIASLFELYILNQNSFFACIGAVVAMERNIYLSLRAALIRNVGTILGGAIGILIGSFTKNIFIMALGLIPLIGLSNRIRKQESIVPGAIVYFAVFFLNNMEDCWRYGVTRILGTLTGTIIALLVNTLILPPKNENREPI